MDERNYKERILSSAAELFQKFGIRSISMDDIAHQLGISKKTIYQHFSDKDDIVTHAVRHYIARKRDELLQLRTTANDAVEAMIKVHEQMHRNVRQTTSLLLFELQKYHQKAWNLMNEFKNGFVAEIVRLNLRTGVEQGYFREDIDIDVVSRLRLEEVTMAVNEDVFPKDQFDHHLVSVRILDHFIHAITNERGKKIYQKYKDSIKTNGTNQTHEARK